MQPVYLCASEKQVHVRMSRTRMGVACDGEAVKAAQASSEFSHVASLGEQGKTSRHRRSQAIFRPPPSPGGRVGKSSDLINDSKRDDFDECRKGSSLHLRFSPTASLLLAAAAPACAVCAPWQINLSPPGHF